MYGKQCFPDISNTISAFQMKDGLYCFKVKMLRSVLHIVRWHLRITMKYRMMCLYHKRSKSQVHQLASHNELSWMISQILNEKICIFIQHWNIARKSFVNYPLHPPPPFFKSTKQIDTTWDGEHEFTGCFWLWRVK